MATPYIPSERSGGTKENVVGNAMVMRLYGDY